MLQSSGVSSPVPSHRSGYLIAAGLALGIAVANGLARFAYALILPAMRADLGWSYTEAGSLNTTNAVGYLLGSIVAFQTVRRWGAKPTFISGLWLTAVTVVATGFSRDFLILSALRFVTGATCAYVFIAGSVLAASVFPNDARRAAASIAIYFGGGGAGVLISGLVLPWILARGGDAAWPATWIMLGLLSLLASLGATMAARPVNSPPALSRSQPWPMRQFLALFLAYSCFALGYIAYMTFIVAWMRAHGATQFEIAATWCVLGVSNLLGPHIWGRSLSRWSHARPMAGIMLIIGIGAALPLFADSIPGVPPAFVMLLSVALFGNFFMVPASITAYVKRTLPAAVWGEAIAAFTVAFSALQCAGPIVTGIIADLTGSLSDALNVSAAILIAGASLALLQRDPALPRPTMRQTP